MEASGVAQFAGGPEDRRLRLVLLGPLSDQRLFCGWELASRACGLVVDLIAFAALAGLYGGERGCAYDPCQ